MHLRGHPRLRLLAFLPLAALLLLLSAPSASAARFLVKVIDAEIAPKKSTFLRWDTGIGKMTLPDPFVVIDIAGQRLTTDVVKDNINPKWDASKIFELDGKERVYIYVYDKDRSSDDLIGKTEMNFKDFLHSASLSFGKVHALRIQVQALDTPPPVRAEPTPPTPPPPPVRVEPTPPTPPPPPVRVEPTPPTPPPPPVRVEPTPPTPPPPPVRVEPTPPVRVEPPVAPEPRKPEGRPISPDAPPLAKSALSDDDFCVALQTFRLECLRASIQSPDDPRSAIVSRMEAAIKARDPLIFKSCQRNLQPKKIKASEACLACARNAGCKARGWDVICAKECKDPKDAEVPAVRPAEVPPVPPVERRDEPSTPPTPPTPPVERRDEPSAPPTPPTPPVERRDEAPPLRLPGIVTAPGDLTPEIFCNRLIDHQMVCVKQRLEEMQRDPAQAQRSAMMKAMVERFTASRPSIVQNCVASYAKEQTRRQSQGEPALSSKQLGDCLLCLQQGGCARAAQQQCRALCSPSGRPRRSQPSAPPPAESPVRPSP